MQSYTIRFTDGIALNTLKKKYARTVFFSMAFRTILGL